MVMQEQLRKLLESCVSSFNFDSCNDVQGCIKDSYGQMHAYFAKNSVDRELVDLLYGIIRQVSKKEKVDFSKYSDKQLWDMATMLNKESQDGCYTYDFGVVWMGKVQYDKATELFVKMKEAAMPISERFKASLLDGRILGQLKEDFPDMLIQDSQSYLGYFKGAYYSYAGNVFATYKNYKLELISIGILAPESLINAKMQHLRLNEHVGFRMVNMKTSHIMSVKSYSDIKKILSKA